MFDKKSDIEQNKHRLNLELNNEKWRIYFFKTSCEEEK